MCNLSEKKPKKGQTSSTGNIYSSLSICKLGQDVSGPYPKSLSGNEYVIGFVDWYSGWPEVFAVPDKTAETVAHLLLEEIIPRYSTTLQIVTDNSSDNINRVMKHTLQEMTINHVTISYYHPQGNSKVEQFHWTLHDVMSKKVSDNLDTQDIYLNQVLAANRFNFNESTNFSPICLLYSHDPVLPIDNIFEPRRRYLGEEPHKVGLEQQHII